MCDISILLYCYVTPLTPLYVRPLNPQTTNHKLQTFIKHSLKIHITTHITAVSQELFTVFPGQEVGFEQFYEKQLMCQKLAHPLVDGKQESIDNGMLSFVLMRR